MAFGRSKYTELCDRETDKAAITAQKVNEYEWRELGSSVERGRHYARQFSAWSPGSSGSGWGVVLHSNRVKGTAGLRDSIHIGIGAIHYE